MAAIDPARVRAYLAAGDNATTNAAKGKALEDLIAYVFECVPGVVVTVRNQMNAFDAEEIDVAFWNDGLAAGLRLFDHLLLVECKNWSSPIGYPEVALFNQKLRGRGRPLGILVAAHGITGDPESLKNAHSVLAQALVEQREILVLTRAELEQLVDTDELVSLLKRKRAQLAVAGTIIDLP
jgi:hypothetical protein